MTTVKKTIGNLIDAHSWLGVIIAVPLFIVFWAGSISLFRGDIALWAQAPHAPVDHAVPDLPLEEIVRSKLAEYRLNSEEHLTLRLPGEHGPYLHMYIDLLPEEGDEGPEQVLDLVIDPKTGRTVAHGEDLHLADFLYELHYNLKLPGGMYIVGIITLYFLILIFSGILIHARKMVSHFFAYRRKRKRTKLLDIHNVIGVMSLPYTVMYAITGLIFNLSIIYQIAFAVFLYQGDQEALLTDAGYPTVAEKLSGNAMAMTNAWSIIADAASEHGAPAEFVRFYSYGDENAHVQMFGEVPGSFARHYDVTYRVSDGVEVAGAAAASSNVVRQGLDVVAALHFGSFAGVDLRLLYFVLGMGIAGMIVVGNLLWLEKRTVQMNVSPAGIRFVRNLSIAGFGGTIVGTAAAFLAERVLPAGLTGRSDWMEAAFLAGLATSSLAAFTLRDKRRLLCVGGLVTAGLLFLTAAADWLLFAPELGSLAGSGAFAAVGVDIALVLAGLLFAAVGGKLGGAAGSREARSTDESRLPAGEPGSVTD